MKTLLLSILCLPLSLLGMTFESSRLEDIIPHVQPQALILFDLDNTLIESTQHLGSAQWRNHIRQKSLAAGFSIDEAEAILDRFWIFTQPLITVRLVDSSNLNLLSKLKENHLVLVLTGREPIEKEYTIKQIQSVDLSFDNPQLVNQPLNTKKPSLYHDGVLFSGENPKSETLLTFLKTFSIQPTQIVFIDDDPAKINELSEVLKQEGIDFVGMRYSDADARVKNFNPAAADIQWMMLPKLISDAEAESLFN